MRRYKQQIRRVFIALFAVLIFCAPGIGTAADKTDSTKKTDSKTTTKDISRDVTQTYNAEPTVQIGMLVKLKDKAGDVLVPVSSDKAEDILGVVIPADNAKIVLTSETAKQKQVLVASSGPLSMLVSNQNGPVKAGDYLAVSAVAGVAMKADDQQKFVVGRATSDFSGSSGIIGSLKVKDTLGKESNVSIGRVEADLRIASNPLYQKSASFVPAFAAKAASAIADKPVSVARIYLSMAVLGVTALVTSIVMYSGIRSGMIAVGRNPLSKKSIIRSLIQTVIAGLIIFLAGVFAVYLLLKL
ncbi:MAG: hypothetical protein U0524_01465 [Candidatus Saccharimonadales bacterium]